MARCCEVCGKQRIRGGNYVMKGIPKKKGGIGLHCTGNSKRWFKPNLQRIQIKKDGTVRRVYVCTACIQKGKIAKA